MSHRSLLFAIQFATMPKEKAKEASMMHVCILHQTEEACLGKTLPKGWFGPKTTLPPLVDGKPQEWPCTWKDDEPSDYPCVNENCTAAFAAGEEWPNLYSLQWKIVAEYDALLFWMLSVCECVVLMMSQDVYQPLHERLAA